MVVVVCRHFGSMILSFGGLFDAGAVLEVEEDEDGEADDHDADDDSENRACTDAMTGGT